MLVLYADAGSRKLTLRSLEGGGAASATAGGGQLRMAELKFASSMSSLVCVRCRCVSTRARGLMYMHGRLLVQFGVRSKVQVRKLSRILTNPKNAVRELSKVRRTLCPFSNFRVQNCSQKCRKSLRWPSSVLILCVLNTYNIRDGSYGLLRRPIRYNTLLIRNTRIIRKCIFSILGGTLGLHQPPSNHHELSPQPPEQYNASW